MTLDGPDRMGPEQRGDAICCAGRPIPQERPPEEQEPDADQRHGESLDLDGASFYVDTRYLHPGRERGFPNAPSDASRPTGADKRLTPPNWPPAM